MAKKKPTEKPVPRTKTAYDYNQCRDYLEAKYGYEERDYVGMFKEKKVNEEVEYLDFWHWVLDRHTIHNGCYVTFSKEELDEIDKEWVREIYSHYIEEFADDNGELELYVWW